MNGSSGRPRHVAALDLALWESLDDYETRQRDLERFLDHYQDIIERLRELLRSRAQAFSDAQNAEDAIRKLGYVVVGRDGVMPASRTLLPEVYSATKDMEAARQRRAGGEREGDVELE